MVGKEKIRKVGGKKQQGEWMEREVRERDAERKQCVKKISF